MQRWQKRATTLLVSTILWGCGGAPVVPAAIAERPDVRSDMPAARRPASNPLLAEATPEAAKPRKKARNGEMEEVKRTYEEWIKKPETLGFDASETLYRNIYFHARNAFVADVTDQQMIAGLKKELGNFLEQVKVNPAPLSALDGTKPVDAYAKVQELFKGKVNANLLGFATMNGLLDGLKDNYSVLLTPQEWGRMEEQLNSKEFGGIGIYIELDRDAGNVLTIFEPIEGTPAYSAGLLPGDRLVKIDGKDTKGVSLDSAMTMIRGLPGTPVVLTIERDNTTKEVTVNRAKIKTISVTSRMFPGDIGYIRVRSFAADTGSELEAALAKLKSNGAKGIVMDLRNNGGGYIDAAVDVVGQYAPRQSLVVYTLNRSGKRQEYRNQNQGGLGVPSVCMINEYSASASEITAGALRDLKLSTLVGDHSFGKGSVQQLYNLEPGKEESARLKLTVARFYTPGGSVIDHKGVDPQVTVDMEPRFVGKIDKDIQLKKAVEMLGGHLK